MNKQTWLRIPLGICAALGLLLIALSVITLDINKRQRANEASSVAKLARINELQGAYAAAHADRGFACELSTLMPQQSTGATYNPDSFLLSGEHSGYKFSLNCEKQTNGVVSSYEVTAVPIEPGKTGYRIFCSDPAGTIWYDPDRSAQNCFLAKRPLR